MKEIKTGLGMPVKSTPLMCEIEELLQQRIDIKDAKERLKKQEEKVITLMKENKQYSVRYGQLLIEYEHIEESQRIRIGKN